MTEYVYNPRKKVTELLSKYIEFDPKQLQLGIWSGHLSLNNVQLRQEALYPILNSRNSNVGAARRRARSATATTDHSRKPPLRFKLVSGSIGTLDIRIPWKRLVWGQGDVQVDVLDVVLVLALETREETWERYRKERDKKRKEKMPSDEDENDKNDSEDCIFTFLDELEGDEGDTEEMDPETRRLRRKKRQKRLRDAERRLLKGQPLGPWLNRVKKKEDEELAKIMQDEEAPIKKDGRFEKWVRETMKDFVWRFFAGIQWNCENLNLVMVQDGVEIGLSVPRFIGIAGKEESASANSVLHDEDVSSTTSGATPPQTVIYQGAYEDGEHIDKHIKVMQTGIYVRKQTAYFTPAEDIPSPADIAAREFVLRPVDLEFSFSIFFPHPPEKRKKLASQQKARVNVEHAPPPSIAGSASSTSGKRRREKREKESVDGIEQTTAILTEEPTSGPPSSPEHPPMFHRRLATAPQLQMNMSPATDGKMSMRRSSLLAPMRLKSVAKPPSIHRRTQTIPFPLSQPENVDSGAVPVLASGTSGEPDLTARFEGKVNVGAVVTVVSSIHYDLMSSFLAGSERIRNGRPTKTIMSVLDHGHTFRKAITVTAYASALDSSNQLRASLRALKNEQPETGPAEVRLELHSGRLDGSEVIVAWWRYAIGAVLWELRQRRRVRKAFRQRFLSFSWEKLKYRRSEYVRLYVKRNLRCEKDAPVKSEIERILEIEDELPIEQILLYRSLARAVHVLGRTEMPDSILELRVNQNFDASMKQNASKSPTEGWNDAAQSEVESFFQSLLETQCEVARSRRDTVHGVLPKFAPFLTWSELAEKRSPPAEIDEVSSATTVSREPRLAVDNSASMLVSFSVKLEEVELLVIDEEMFSPDKYYAGSVGDSGNSNSSLSSVISDVSVLTDDKRFFRGEGTNAVPIATNESLEYPVPLSTDYLLFNSTETLLRLTFAPLELSTRGRSGQFHNLTFSVGKMRLTGENNCDLLAAGDDITPSMEIQKVGVGHRLSAHAIAHYAQRAALFLTVKSGRSGTTVQCDTAMIRLLFDLHTIEKTAAFLSRSSYYFPSPLVQDSPRDMVRRYVLRQNTHAPFFSVTASMRVYGIEAIFPSESVDGSAEFDTGSRCIVRADTFEMYSGTAVDKLCPEDADKFVVDDKSPPKDIFMPAASAQTRSLAMIRAKELLSPSALSHRWVIATSGVDIMVQPSECDHDQLSFFQNPVDVEALLVLNSESVLDYSRAMVESTVKISSIQVLLSAARLATLSKCLHTNLLKSLFSPRDSSPSEIGQLPPRIEVLSRFTVLSLDLSVPGIHFSFLEDDNLSCHIDASARHQRIRECIEAFLKVVSKLDLSFPREEALLPAMQICIDRLVGLGLPSDESWHIANSSLLDFLEEMARHTGDAEGVDDLSMSSAEEILGVAREKTVRKVLLEFAGLLQSDDIGDDTIEKGLLLDLPDGASLSLAHMFYDKHVNITVPTIFALNGDGVHLLRLTTSRDLAKEGSNLSIQEPHSSSFSGTEDYRYEPERPGIAAHHFLLDKQYPFGRGGLALTALANDDDPKPLGRRVREQIDDVEVGEVELLVSRKLLEAVLDVLKRTFSPLRELQQSGDQPPQEHKERNDLIDSHLLCQCRLITALLASDSFDPFSRLVFAETITRMYHFRTQNRISVETMSLELLDLSPESDLRPSVVSVLPEEARADGHESIRPVMHMHAAYQPGSVEVSFNSVRLVLLRQFLNEILQLLNSETYGILRLLSSGKGSDQEPSNELGVKISLVESSILLPRSSHFSSSSSSDMLAIEFETLAIDLNSVVSTFEMPTETKDLLTGVALLDDDINSANEVTMEFMECHSSVPPSHGNEFHNDTLRRISCRVLGARLFTSLQEIAEPEPGSNNHSFDMFYGIDGRAEADKPVYAAKHWVEHEPISDRFSKENEVKAKRCWREISKNKISIDILVDYAPNLRVLIANPSDGSKGELALDVRLSQFCLLLSVWYCNMQELPLLFPYSPDQLIEGAKRVSDMFDFPAFGTDTMRTMLLNPMPFSSEICIFLESLSLRCSFDVLDENGDLVGADPSVFLEFGRPVVHISNDKRGVSRIGAGAASASFVDESQLFQDILLVSSDQVTRSWADLTFGLASGAERVGQKLPQPFQLSIFMTPSWSLYNLGMNAPLMTLSDFSPIFRFLDFVRAYFTDASKGNPSFAAIEVADSLKISLRKHLAAVEEDKSPPGESAGIDFRLWLSSPSLIVPCNGFARSVPVLQIKGDGGLWYRYTSFDTVSIQEVASEGLSLSYCDRFPSKTDNCADEIQPLIKCLSFGVRLDSNGFANHTDYSVCIPLKHTSFGFGSDRINVPPAVVSPSPICSPLEQPRRWLGPKVCEVNAAIEVLPAVSATILNLFTGGAASLEAPDALKTSHHVQTSEDVAPTFSVSAAVGDVRVFALDPVLGCHLPIAMLSIGSIRLTASRFGHFLDKDENVSCNTPAPEDLHVIIDGHLWADYFKLGMTRSWEPLAEPYKLLVLLEKSKLRGSGVTLASESSLHFNVSGALLVILNQVVDVYSRLIKETFSADKPVEPRTLVAPEQRIGPRFSLSESADGVYIIHQKPESIGVDERVPFSLKNLSGQKIRHHHTGRASDLIYADYLDHGQIIMLSFEASISMIKNLSIKEVEFPGISDQSEEVVSQYIDLQIPGFRRLTGLQVGAFGRSFWDITPRSKLLQDRLNQDWRLGNIMKVLIEVGLENGGRQVTVASLFRVLNKTSHEVSILCHPDPSFSPTDNIRSVATLNKSEVPHESMSQHCVDATVEPGGSYHVPILLLHEALQRQGTYLGCLWLRPTSATQATDATQRTEGDLSIGFSSRSVHLARIVGESAVIFQAARGHDVPQEEARTGVQISCPVTRASGDRLAPFCYAVEVGRSPLVASGPERDRGVGVKSKYVHGPVSYTLSLYAPFVIVNLLPKRGRFELMHAVRKTVVWFADLQPGEQMAIHSVGLDAPLLLLVNLGFCRTPVGEGALVHHGADPPAGVRDNLGGFKSIGKAGKAVTRQLGKTLTSIGESPDKRVQHKADFLRFQRAKGRPHKVGSNQGASPDIGMGGDGTAQVGGKTYRIETSVFFPDDVSDETTVVDSLGQRLTLNIENKRGGGGQRRIAIFCPFWIVNTTEHALRYKQENSKMLVSGTVLSPTKNGSTSSIGPDDFDNLHGLKMAPIDRHPQQIFSGTVGGLALSKPGNCDLGPEEVAWLLDSSLPLERLAELAFMFNFHDNIGAQRMSVQLGDGTGASHYESEWSRGLSLDSVGIPQVASMHCKDGRFLELTLLVYVAPGSLSSYSKIVRVLPRYVVVNMLPYPVRLWQDSSVFRSAASDQESSAPKWRFDGEQGKKGRVNQYELLWGREAVVDDGFEGDMSRGTSAHETALYISTVASAMLVPFSLPDSREERQLRIGVGAPWRLTSSFSADVAGDHVLALTRGVDLKMLPHVSTRSSPEFQVSISPKTMGFNNELGVWFETEWGSSRSVIVKAVKKNSFAFNQTDIHVGDELLKIDAIPVSKKTFVEVISILRTRLEEIAATKQVEARKRPRRSTLRLGARSQSSHLLLEEDKGEVPPLTLTFRTVEERLRRVRLKAARRTFTSRSARDSFQLSRTSEFDNQRSSAKSLNEAPARYIKAELKTLHHMMFLVLREEDKPPFRIQNQTLASRVYFRQKGCNQHPWFSLKPGEVGSYAWQEPLKTKRLSVRVLSETLFQFPGGSESFEVEGPTERLPMKRGKFAKWIGAGKVRSDEDTLFSPVVNVLLEEIGFKDFLVYRKPEDISATNWLELEVDVSDATRILTVRDMSNEGSAVPSQIHLDALESGIAEEENRLTDLHKLDDGISELVRSNVEVDDRNGIFNEIETTAKTKMGELSTGIIHARHQILVEVLEAFHLVTDTFVGDCNPYVEVSLKSGGRKRPFSRRKVQRTYYVKKTVNPTWEKQSFLFDVPPSAAVVPHGHAISVDVRSYRSFRRNRRLGRTLINLHSVRNQEALVGWFPLAGRTGLRELEDQLSHWGRGSIRLKVQWIYSVPSLVQYFTMITENRLTELTTRRTRLSEQIRERRMLEEKQRNEMDDFAAPRIQELLSFSDQLRIGNLPFRFPRNPPERRVLAKKLVRPPRSSQRLRLTQETTQGPHVSSSPIRELHVSSPSYKTIGGRNRAHAGLSDQILLKQKQLSQISFARTLHEKRNGTPRTHPGKSTSFVLSSLKSWTTIQALFNEKDLGIKLDEGKLEVRLRSPALPAHRRRMNIFKSEDEIVARKLELPVSAPPPCREFAAEQIRQYAKSRASFERTAMRSLSSIFHQGGWLTIRPIRALNISENYSLMSVKLRYGTEILTTGPADARVAPVWTSNRLMPVEDTKTKSNDLHIRVRPFRTNGLIRLSVVGERGRQQLQGKTELGILYMPLGSAIAACIDHDSFQYQRWFPLVAPKDAVPVEGDGGPSFQAPDSEQIDEKSFENYYMPCIELALIWHPDQESLNKEEVHGQPGTTQLGLHAMPRAYFNADLARISAALIDSDRAFELLSFNALDLDVRFLITNTKTHMGVSVRWLQLDHQDEEAREPIILAPTPNDFLFPVLHVIALKDNARSAKIASFDFVDVSIAEFDLTIEESFIFDLVGFISSVLLRQGINKMSSKEKWPKTSSSPQNLIKEECGAESEDPSLLSLLMGGFTDEKKATKVYIEQLFLGVLRFNLSYVKGKRNVWDRADGRMGTSGLLSQMSTVGGEFLDFYTLHNRKSNVFASWSRQTSDEDQRAEDIELPFQNIPMFLSSLFPNLSDAPVRLQRRTLNHVFESPTEIFKSLRKFYVNETLGQIYKIIGSLDFVGNPTLLVSSFVSGVRDLVVTPSAAFLKDPTDPSMVGIGVAKGTLSLLSHSTSGFFAFCAKVSATAGQTVATLSLDPDLREWHRDRILVEATNINRQWKRRGMQSFGAMVARPIGDLLIGIGGGIFGVILIPAKWYRREGSPGLTRGVVVGCMGVIARPIVGVLDALFHFTASIHDVAKSVNILDRRLQPAKRIRLPYAFGLMNIMMPFEDSLARTALLLRLYPRKKPSTQEYIIHVEVLPNNGIDTYAIATTARVILIRLKKEVSGVLTPSLCWELTFSPDTVISSKVADHGHSGVALTITLVKPPGPEDDIGECTTPRSYHLSDSFRLTSGSQSNMLERDMDSTSDIERPSVDASREFDHTTARGGRGEILEWFTILAEYQYRRQLGRLHNAISCIVGDFDAVLLDSSLRQPGSCGSEGYTSFGIYHFDKDDADPASLQRARSNFPSQLENLPWVSEYMLEEATRKLHSPRDDDVGITGQLRDWGLSRYLEASRKEGGPDWLIQARARALFVDSSVTDDSPSSDSKQLQTVEEESVMTQLAGTPAGRELEGRRTSRPKLVSWDRSATSFRSPFGLRRFSGRTELSSSLRSPGESTAGAAPSTSGPGEQGDLVEGDISDISQSNVQSTNIDEELTAPELSRHESEYSFVTARGSIPKSWRDFFSPQSQSGPGSPTRSPLAAGGSEDEGTPPTPTTVPKKLNSVPATITEATAESSSRQLPDDRLSRVEALMERLIVFTSEQTLHRHDGTAAVPMQQPPVDETASLRNEIAELRAELRRRDKVEAAVSEVAAAEVSALRDEISLLKTSLEGFLNFPAPSQPVRDIEDDVADRIEENDQSTSLARVDPKAKDEGAESSSKTEQPLSSTVEETEMVVGNVAVFESMSARRHSSDHNQSDAFNSFYTAHAASSSLRESITPDMIDTIEQENIEDVD